MKVITTGHVEDNLADPQTSKQVRNWRLPRFQLRMEGGCNPKYVASIEELMDLHGIPEERYLALPFQSFFALLSPLDRILRPRPLKHSNSAGYKLRSPRELVLDPENLFNICNMLEGSQYGAPEKIPKDIRVQTAGSVRIGAIHRSNVYELNYLPTEGTQEHFIYWATIDEKRKIHLASLDVKFTGDYATISVYLGVPERKPIDDFTASLIRMGKGEFTVVDRRYDGIDPATGKGKLAAAFNPT